MKQRNLSRRQARWTEFLADFDLNFEYVRGEDNLVADALSRRDLPDDCSATPASVSCVAVLSEFRPAISETLRTKILAGYDLNPFCCSLKLTLPFCDDCLVCEDLIWINGCLLIPAVGGLRQRLMDKAHVFLGHLGYLKTITELCCDFFWPKMACDVNMFVLSCKTCQKTKAPTTAPTGKMLTPEFPCLPLTHISIDFVGPLKTSGHYDMLLSVTCRLSGFTWIIPVLQKDTAEKTAS
jgi:hypothetical protein